MKASFPTLTFDSLLASGIFDKKGTRNIGSHTTAEFVRGTMDGADDFIVIYHHSTVIAQISRQSVYVTNAGWSSMSTLQRLDTVAVDNDLPVRFTVRDGAAVMLERFTRRVARSFEEMGGGVTLYRSPIGIGGWARKADNGLTAY